MVMAEPKYPNRIALITGAGRRIGRTIALHLAAAGWQVVVHYFRSAKAAEEVVEKIQASGGSASMFRADIREEGAPFKLINSVNAAIGPITCLINNASVFENDTVFTANKETWDLHMGVNLRAPFELAQSFAKQLPEDNEANIINIIDQRVWNLTSDFTTYTLSKVGLWGLTQILARALAPGIRVNGVGPGPTVQSIHQSAEAFAQEWGAIPLKRRVLPEEVASAVKFILETPSMTGQMIAIDSGQHMGITMPEQKANTDIFPT